MNRPPWLILGAGSLGRLLACRLATEVDLALLGRQASPAPLALTSPDGRETTHRMARLRVAQAPRQPAVVHVTTKSYAVEAALAELAAIMDPTTPLVLWQNGYRVQEPLTRRWAGPVLCATTSEGAYVQGNDGIVHAGRGRTWLGHLDGGHAALAKSIAMTLDHAGLTCEACHDIRRRLWHKLAVNASINPLVARHRIRNGQLREPAYRPHIDAVIDELVRVMAAEGIAPPDAGWAAMIWQVIDATASNRASMLQDVLAGRPTERDAILGPLLDAASRSGIDVPILHRLWKETPG